MHNQWLSNSPSQCLSWGTEEHWGQILEDKEFQAVRFIVVCKQLKCPTARDELTNLEIAINGLIYNFTEECSKYVE